MFTGNPEGIKSFKVWVMEEQKCVISRNVVFREDKVFKELSDEGEESHDLQLSPKQKIVNVEYEESSGQMSDVQGEVIISDSQNGDSEESAPDQTNEESLSDYLLGRDITRRHIIPPVRFSDYECEFVPYEEEYAVLMRVLAEDGGSQPRSFQEAMRDADSDKWIKVAKEEMVSLIKNQTWKLVDKP